MRAARKEAGCCLPSPCTTILHSHDNRTRSEVIILSLLFYETISIYTLVYEWNCLLLINLTSPFLSIWQIAIDTKISCHFLWVLSSSYKSTYEYECVIYLFWCFNHKHYNAYEYGHQSPFTLHSRKFTCASRP